MATMFYSYRYRYILSAFQTAEFSEKRIWPSLPTLRFAAGIAKISLCLGTCQDCHRADSYAAPRPDEGETHTPQSRVWPNSIASLLQAQDRPSVEQPRINADERGDVSWKELVAGTLSGAGLGHRICCFEAEQRNAQTSDQAGVHRRRSGRRGCAGGHPIDDQHVYP